jgi:CRISPR-associated protein Cmr3
MQTIKMQALDTLFFRDGKPFAKGEENYIEGINFPPLPSVIYGAIRTGIIAESIAQQNIIDLIKITESMTINMLAVKLNSDISFPLPKDLAIPKRMNDGKENKDNSAIKLLPTSSPEFSNTKLDSILMFAYGVKMKDELMFISKTDLEDYLNGEFGFIRGKSMKNFSATEHKTGIGRNQDTHIADEGNLYRVDMIRPKIFDKKGNEKSVEIVVSINNAKIHDTALIQLGGEKKIAKLGFIENIEIESPKDLVNEFKIYLATPAIFEHGWYPGNFIAKFNLELINAALDKPINVGGWDLDKKQPKPMMQAVPAGAVYYLKANDKLPNKINEAITYLKECHCISDFDTGKQGFGIAFCGKI